MSNPRTPLSTLRLSGSPNLRRALKREEADAEKLAQLSPEAKSEIEQLDALIQQALAACRRGMTLHGKANPAYRNLSALIKARKAVLESKRPPPSTEDVLASLDKIFSGTEGPPA